MGGVDYQYDGEGRRMQQTVSSTVTKYLLDIQPGLSVVLSETTGSNVVRNVHAPKGIHARKDASSNWHWMMQDGLGSVRAEVSNNIAVEGSQNFAPYGNAVDSLGNFGTYGFTGEPTDVNGLVYDRARYYVPNIGMFASLDPFEGIWNEPMSINGYGYVHGNPVNWTDPSGEIIAAPVLPLLPALGPVGWIILAVVVGIGVAWAVSQVLNSGCCTGTGVKEKEDDGLADNGGSTNPNGEPLDPNPLYQRPKWPFVGPGQFPGLGSEPFWFPYQRPNPYTQPKPLPVTPTPQPTPTPTPQPCDKQVFSTWWATVPNAPPKYSPPSAFAWENSIARNGWDTFSGNSPKRVSIPGSKALGLKYDTIDADGASRETCRLIDAKHQTSSFPNLNTPFVYQVGSDLWDELSRYKRAIGLTPAVGIEIRTNSSQSVPFWIAALQTANFTYNVNGFVEVYYGP